ncbi:hypothetical protein BDZ45DRAFT_193940 [Acephala macrosclerotiorum]|nr:hypothetical protein BDZ45DRAFT_193940 [Acephala macrosclerotiorum]
MLCRNTFSKYLLLLLLIGLGLAANSNPQTVQWSSKSYGPDGPWQAVTLSIGTPPQTFDLLPGGVWASPVLAPSVCANGVSCSVAKEAGFYNPSTSNTAFEIDQTGKVVNSSLGGADAALGSLTGSANWMFDTMSIHLRDGIVGNTYFAEVQDFNMLVVSEAYETLPDGTTYPMQIGHLSLGAPEFNESWLHFPPNPRWNGTLLPSALFEQGNTPSNSYGLHIGSEALGIPGSLNIGGFDPSRALGPVSSQVYAINRLPIDLLDIGIGVTEGASPFNFTSQIGLLAEGNSSLGVSTSVLVEPQVPYIYLLQSSCDAITEYLPVTFQMKYGLYFWNTKDPSYERIVTSPSFLSFTFRLSDSISQNMTIKVPLTLLNLTLTQPIIDTPTQYLPLRPGQGPSGGYELGRAFLQAAFIGVNWQTAQGDGEGAWFLAQAPGPNTPSKYPLTVINAKDSTIIGSNASWEDTWKGSWTVIESSGNPSIASEYLMGETVPISSYKRSGFGPRELEARNSIAKPVEMAG